MKATDFFEAFIIHTLALLAAELIKYSMIKIASGSKEEEWWSRPRVVWGVARSSFSSSARRVSFLNFWQAVLSTLNP